jgi:outer membrane protein
MRLNLSHGERRRTRILSAALALGLAAISAGAQESRSGSLTLEECIELGLRNSKPVHASQMNVDVALARSREVRASRLPSLQLGGGYTRLSEVPPFEVRLPFPPGMNLPTSIVVSRNYYDGFALKVGLRQPVFTGFRLKGGVEAAQFEKEAAANDLESVQSETVYRIRAAYWGLFRAREVRKAVDENVAQVEAHLTDVRNLFEHGLLTKNEVLKVDVQLSSARLARLDAANAVETAAVWLNSLIGAPLDAPVEPATSVEEMEGGTGSGPETGGSLDALLDKALNERADLKAMGFRAKAGEAGVTVAKAGGYPQVFLSGNYYDMKPNSRLLPAQNRFYSTWDVSLNVSMDLWNWGATLRQTQQARARLAMIQDGLGQLRDAAAVEVRQHWLALGRAREKIAVAREAVGQAGENLRVTVERFKEGVALNSDVLDAESAHLAARTNYAQALVDLELVKAGLARAVGE